eukprot:scaffold2987_cov170-Amphora_coffeaeformis.AAC.18
MNLTQHMCWTKIRFDPVVSRPTRQVEWLRMHRTRSSVVVRMPFVERSCQSSLRRHSSSFGEHPEKGEPKGDSEAIEWGIHRHIVRQKNARRYFGREFLVLGGLGFEGSYP